MFLYYPTQDITAKWRSKGPQQLLNGLRTLQNPKHSEVKSEHKGKKIPQLAGALIPCGLELMNAINAFAKMAWACETGTGRSVLEDLKAWGREVGGSNKGGLGQSRTR